MKLACIVSFSCGRKVSNGQYLFFCKIVIKIYSVSKNKQTYMALHRFAEPVPVGTDSPVTGFLQSNKLGLGCSVSNKN